MRVMMRMGIVKIMVIALFGKDSEIGGNYGGDDNIDVYAGEN